MVLLSTHLGLRGATLGNHKQETETLQLQILLGSHMGTTMEAINASSSAPPIRGWGRGFAFRTKQVQFSSDSSNCSELKPSHSDACDSV